MKYDLYKRRRRAFYELDPAQFFYETVPIIYSPAKREEYYVIAQEVFNNDMIYVWITIYPEFYESSSGKYRGVEIKSIEDFFNARIANKLYKLYVA